MSKPAEGTDAALASVRAGETGTSPSGSMRVLVCEEDEGARRLLVDGVRAWGYQCATVDDGTQAWEVLARGDGDMLIVPEWDHLYSASMLMHRLRASSLPYVYCLGTSKGAEAGARDQEKLPGADGYVTLPSSNEELGERLSTAEGCIRLSRHRESELEWLRGAVTGLTEQARTPRHLRVRDRAELGRDLPVLAGRVERYGHCYCLALFRVGLVDQAGAPVEVADAIVDWVAETFATRVRSGDAIYRYDARTIAVVLPEQTTSTAMHMAERMRREVEAASILSPGPSDCAVMITSALAVLELTRSAGPPLPSPPRRPQAPIR